MQKIIISSKEKTKTCKYKLNKFLSLIFLPTCKKPVASAKQLTAIMQRFSSPENIKKGRVLGCIFPKIPPCPITWWSTTINIDKILNTSMDADLPLSFTANSPIFPLLCIVRHILVLLYIIFSIFAIKNVYLFANFYYITAAKLSQ